MARDNVVKVRVNEKEFNCLKTEAEHRGVGVSEVIRDLIKLLNTEEVAVFEKRSRTMQSKEAKSA